MTTKQILKLAREKGIKITPYEDNETMASYEDSSVRFDWVIEDLPNCCGVKEIGNLSLSYEICHKLTGKKDSAEGIKSLLAVYAIAYTFADIYEQARTKGGKIKTAYTLIYCGNGKKESKIAEEILQNWFGQQYIPASKTRSPKTRNVITTYVSRF